jgi:hypothetical protein
MIRRGCARERSGPSSGCGENRCNCFPARELECSRPETGYRLRMSRSCMALSRATCPIHRLWLPLRFSPPRGRFIAVRYKLAEYCEWDVPHAWLVDPDSRRLYNCDESLRGAETLRVPEPDSEVTPAHIFDQSPAKNPAPSLLRRARMRSSRRKRLVCGRSKSPIRLRRRSSRSTRRPYSLASRKVRQ